MREGIVAGAWGDYIVTLHPQCGQQRKMDAWVQRPFPFVHGIFLYKQKLPVKAAAAESQNRCGVGSSRFLTQSPGHFRKACWEIASISICCRSLPCMTVLRYSSLRGLWSWTEAITLSLPQTAWSFFSPRLSYGNLSKNCLKFHPSPACPTKQAVA